MQVDKTRTFLSSKMPMLYILKMFFLHSLEGNCSRSDSKSQPIVSGGLKSENLEHLYQSLVYQYKDLEGSGNPKSFTKVWACLLTSNKSLWLVLGVIKGLTEA